MEIILNPDFISPVAFKIFSYPIKWYGIILSFSLFIGIILSYFTLLKKTSKNEADNFINFIPFLCFFSILGARIFYIIGNLNFYLNNKIEILLINHGGLSIWGAIVFGFFTLLYYCRKNKYSISLYSDTIALCLPLCQAIGRIGNFINQEAYGYPSNFFIKLYVSKPHRYDKFSNSEYYHPAFLYEMIFDIIIFLILFKISKKHLKEGVSACIYIILYSIIRIFVEFIRIDSVLYIFNIPIAVYLSLFAIFCAIFSLFIIYKTKK